MIPTREEQAYRGRIDELAAENAKLRAALDAIRRHSDPDSEAYELALRALED